MTFLQKVTQTEIRNILAITSVLGAFAVLIILCFKPIPGQNKETVNLCVGFVLGGLIAGVNGYYFGASKNDKPKE